MHRLFVALRPPPAIRATLLTITGGVEGVRWQDDEQLHLTLRFIGTVPRPQAEDIAAAIGGIAAPAVTARIAGVGQFDRRGRTDTLWAGVDAPPIGDVARKVAHAVTRAGVPPETRAFLPHITLGRIGRAGADGTGIAAWLACHAALATPAFTFTHLVLYESHLASSGARYEAVARWPLH